MARFISKVKHIYFLLYTLILYYFCISLHSKEHLFKRNSSFDNNGKELVKFIATIEEKKFLVDFKYKKEVHSSLMNTYKENLVFVDPECRILGSKSVIYQDHLSARFSVYLNKKFLHSFLLGSIKLIPL
jgi:hypothetical protein